jgi:hypothetical protein
MTAEDPKTGLTPEQIEKLNQETNTATSASKAVAEHLRDNPDHVDDPYIEALRTQAESQIRR